MDKVKIGFPIEYEDDNNIVRNGLFLREPEITELEKRLKEINKITDLKQQCQKQKEVIDRLNFIKNRKNQGASQENINKMAIKFVNSYLKEVSE